MLIKYELLKIVRKKSTAILMAISLLLTAFLFTLPVIRYQTYNHDGVIKGINGIAYEKEQLKSQSAPLTDEYVTSTVSEYQRLFENPENVGYDGNERFLVGNAYWNFAAPRTKLLNMIAANYDTAGENSGWNKLPDMNLQNGTGFYTARSEKINAVLNSPSRELSQQQKSYWRSMNDKVSTPFQYGYYEGWETIVSSFELLMFAILAVCIVIAPVFSGEYQSGTAAVILAAKHGKTKLITAKIISAFVFGTLMFTLHTAVALVVPLTAFGTDGWNLPLQIANTAIPYPLTFLQATLINLGIIYLVLLAMISITLLLSTKMKSPYLVLIVLVPILFIPLFLIPNGTTGLYNLILFLLPYRATVPEFSKYLSYQFGGVVLDVHCIRAILYALLTVITIPFTRLGFKEHQLSA